jgi:hypothetical protein
LWFFLNKGKYPLISKVKQILNNGRNATDEPIRTTPPTTTTTTVAQTGTTIPTSPTTTTPKCPTDGFFPDKSSNCKRYYQCVKPLILTHQCPSGTFFDVTAKPFGACNWITANSKCWDIFFYFFFQHYHELVFFISIYSGVKIVFFFCVNSRRLTAFHI